MWRVAPGAGRVGGCTEASGVRCRAARDGCGLAKECTSAAVAPGARQRRRPGLLHRIQRPPGALRPRVRAQPRLRLHALQGLLPVAPRLCDHPRAHVCLLVQLLQQVPRPPSRMTVACHEMSLLDWYHLWIWEASDCTQTCYIHCSDSCRSHPGINKHVWKETTSAGFFSTGTTKVTHSFLVHTSFTLSALQTNLHVPSLLP